MLSVRLECCAGGNLLAVLPLRKSEASDDEVPLVAVHVL